jgi:teichuronic acid biosynthesis glycosyltransferase TuaC
MRVLAITKIFPNAIEPMSSPFNRQQLARLSERCQVEVMATIPWFPGIGAFRPWSAAAKLTRLEAREEIDGLVVHHPRFFYVPRVGHAVAGPLYAGSLLRAVHRRRNDFDVILGSWAYPDGYAAVALGRLLGIPTVVKLHGSDMNVVAELAGPRAMLRWALPRATRIVAVSRPLAKKAQAFGVAADRIDVVLNGVDQTLFRVADRSAARRALGLPQDGFMVLYVGRIEREKGVLELVQAFQGLLRRLPDARLVMVGDGSARQRLMELARPMGASATFVGARPLHEIPKWLASCGLLALPSWNEGTPNVVLEALACGRRVVATRVGGIPDLICSPMFGELVPPRSPHRLQLALFKASQEPYDPREVARLGCAGDWSESARQIHQALERAVNARLLEEAPSAVEGLT